MSRSSALGFLAGGLAGVVAGMLLAPEEGQKLRRRVVYQLERLADRAATLTDLIQRTNDDSGASARGTGQAVIRTAQEEAARIRAEIDALIGEVRSIDTP
jgi:gas vesicle protein